MREFRVLYVDCYTVLDSKNSQVPSSMSIGYGVTAGRVIRRALESHGIRLVRPLAGSLPEDGNLRAARLKWVLRGYQAIADAVIAERPDIVFVFHSFSTFPAEIRRILLELDSPIPILGYTHGSHWDPSDSLRTERYPGLKILDLANLAALDRILFDSEFMKRIVVDGVGEMSEAVSREIAQKSRVVGLPLDTGFIDSCRPERSYRRTTVVFNHAPVAAKDPAEFARVIAPLMARFDINVIFTRAFDPGDPGAAEVRELRETFGERVILGQDMSLDEYFQALWMSDIQVSTALHESLGMATLEAMYTQNCCLLPSRGSYPEICGDNQAALYNSSAELTERLAHYITQDAERHALAKALAEQAGRYTEPEVMPRILAAIEELAVAARG